MMAKKDWSDDFVHHWKHYVPPARASPSDLEFLRKKIAEKGKDAKVLILGSTPEYRNMCGELGVKLTLLDFKRENYEYLADEVKNMPEETFVEGDWITTVIDKKFDIILGDNVVNMISKENLGKFLSNVASMLKDDGLFIPRTYIRDKGERYTGESAMEVYRKELHDEHLFVNLRDFFVAVYDFDKEYTVFSDAWNLVAGLHAKGLITDEEFEEFDKLSLKDREFRFFIPLREDFDEAVSQYFNIGEIFHGTEKYIRKQLPLHVLTKKR